MCGRYGLFTPPTDLEARFDASMACDFEPTYNAAPSESLPVIDAEQSRQIRTRQWGLIPSWADDLDAHRHTNARAETLFERPSFRESAEQRRCLVLADGFYEWGAPDGQRRPHFVRRTDGEPFAMAGLWERWTPSRTQTKLGSLTAEPEPIETFTIVTTQANDAIEPLHDRMPVVLPPDAEGPWLSADPGRAASLLEPLSAQHLRVDPVSRAVNDPTATGPKLVTPIEQ
ncbi:SOS response-associated peptidase [Halorhabdus sp. CUG00001]|uniref:SOS response-associated peptidase n=1 Tax=Halorhabdus sp. CUG00001 TaxID=2600297 RepID=UPI00131D0D1C|nr:SOS response-associated peptidase [Halorhabdus sp. CUG00001]